MKVIVLFLWVFSVSKFVCFAESRVSIRPEVLASKAPMAQWAKLAIQTRRLPLKQVDRWRHRQHSKYWVPVVRLQAETTEKGQWDALEDSSQQRFDVPKLVLPGADRGSRGLEFSARLDLSWDLPSVVLASEYRYSFRELERLIELQSRTIREIDHHWQLWLAAYQFLYRQDQSDASLKAATEESRAKFETRQISADPQNERIQQIRQLRTAAMQLDLMTARAFSDWMNTLQGSDGFLPRYMLQ